MTSAIQKVKTNLLERGAGGIRGLAIVFRCEPPSARPPAAAARAAPLTRAAASRMDEDRDRKLTKAELKDALTEYNVPLTAADLDELYSQFDKDSDGRITYDEFLIGLRGTLNDSRKSWVEKAFAKLDTDVRCGCATRGP
jgi:hypothetical protein